MNPWLQHLPVLPIVLPLAAGALLLLSPETSRATRGALSLLATLAQLVVAVALLYLTTDAVPDIWSRGIGVYSIGGWPAPFGIVLVVDRLSALMIALDSALVLSAIVYSFVRWDRMGVHYHAMLQFLLVGLNGAFLTGDLFNLFVSIEILLAASYALLLHGGTTRRVRSALHFVVVNLAASFAFLVGVAMIYGVVGTLNMADLATHWPRLGADERGIAGAGAAILAVAFLVKAGSWPFNFWLPGTYSAAGAPVAAVFAITTKVGVYAILRFAALLEVSPASMAGTLLFYGAIATMTIGIAGILATRQLPRLIAYSIALSSGTLLAALAFPGPAMTASALYYLVASVLAAGAFFLLADMTERLRPLNTVDDADPAQIQATYVAFKVGEPPGLRGPDEEVGVAIPAAVAFVGLAYLCCALLLSGMPPLSGFVAKFAMLSAAFDALAHGEETVRAWVLTVALLAGGIAALLSLARIGMHIFWRVDGGETPRFSIVEAAPVAFLLLLCVAMSIAAGPTMTFLDSAARTLHDPGLYVDAVMGAGRGMTP